MNLDAKTLNEHIYFAENLKAAVSELAVTQAELARAIGKDQKTVGRYINGESYPEGSIAQIAEYLLSRLVDKNYFVHIPSAKFEGLFSDIYDYLQDNGIREAEFAKMLGVSQKTLNNYHNHRFNKGEALKLPTEMQWKIIHAFDETEGRFFAFHPDEDDEAQAAVRERHYAIGRRAHYYKGYRIASSMREMWERLIESYKKGVNFFVYSPEKLEFVCFYLHYMIRELKELSSSIQSDWLNGGLCRNYYFQSRVASIDFFWEYNFEKFGLGDDDNGEKINRDRTGYYYCVLLASDIGRFSEARSALSPRERDETNALLRYVYATKTLEIKKQNEELAAVHISPYHFNFNREKSEKEPISHEQRDRLVEIFTALPPELQRIILRCFDVFFWGISFENLDDVLETHYWLTLKDMDTKLKFIEKYEAEIMGDFWETGRKLDDDYYEKYDDKNPGLWKECSQYLRLMSYARTAATKNYAYTPSEEYTREFKKRCSLLAREIDPEYILKAQIDYSPADWYVNMLADIALLKGMRVDLMIDAIES